MPLPRYQPAKKKARTVCGDYDDMSLDALDDGCLSRIIGYAIRSSRRRQCEPHVGSTDKVERNLSLVSKRWYFLTQTQAGLYCVHTINLDEAYKNKTPTNLRPNNHLPPITASKTPSRCGRVPASPDQKSRNLLALSSIDTKCSRSAMRVTSNLRRPTALNCRNNSTTPMRNSCLASGATSANSINVKRHAMAMAMANKAMLSPRAYYDIRLFRLIRPKLLKYKHIQLTGTVSRDNFVKLMIALNSSRVERLDIVRVKIENSHSLLNVLVNETVASSFPRKFIALRELTLTLTSTGSEDSTNALLWLVYERASWLKKFEVYVTHDPRFIDLGTVQLQSHQMPQLSSEEWYKTVLAAENGRDPFSEICQRLFDRENKISDTRHTNLTEVTLKQAPAPTYLLGGALGIDRANSVLLNLCNYAPIFKAILAKEQTIELLTTNETSVIDYLIKSSSRLCTRCSIGVLTCTEILKNFEQLSDLMRASNLGTKFLSVSFDEIDMLTETRLAIEFFSQYRLASARCEFNLHLKDQKFGDCDAKAKELVQICRLVDVIVHIGALQRISIDCCHLMWSTGRALQVYCAQQSPTANSVTALTTSQHVNQHSSLAGTRCIFKITLQTYPVKPNVVNPCEITIPFGTRNSADFKINPEREDLARHREIMRALKKDCYHQFVKSVRD